MNNCDGAYLVLMALALAAVASCHLPWGNPNAGTVAAALGLVLAVIAAISVFVC